MKEVDVVEWQGPISGRWVRDPAGHQGAHAQASATTTTHRAPAAGTKELGALSLPINKQITIGTSSESLKSANYKVPPAFLLIDRGLPSFRRPHCQRHYHQAPRKCLGKNHDFHRLDSALTRRRLGCAINIRSASQPGTHSLIHPVTSRRTHHASHLRDPHLHRPHLPPL
jgi:hypothetical protein